MKKLRKYKKQMAHSYTLGPFPTFEALKKRPEMIERVVYSDIFHEKEKLIALLEKFDIPYGEEPRTLERISGQKNIYVAGVVQKKSYNLEKEKNHILLENIRDMGNLGNICRSALAFNCKNIALIGHCCDYFHPKVIRASMGAFFQQNI
ncbi:MAG: TrmH family RNA methyltransferase, partial [Tissierellia bacterium]|nr:TrmH family RNA methyltransferase [Tissierellia bacterium]